VYGVGLGASSIKLEAWDHVAHHDHNLRLSTRDARSHDLETHHLIERGAQE
jgi:hypothetical protein